MRKIKIINKQNLNKKLQQWNFNGKVKNTSIKNYYLYTMKECHWKDTLHGVGLKMFKKKENECYDMNQDKNTKIKL